MLAAQRALDQVQRGLRGSDTGPQPRRLTDEHRPTLGGVRGGDQDPDRFQAETRTGRLFLALPLFVASGTAP
ncbi:hypothetical protein ACF1BU_19995 [Streptomyces sp. NPDC014724]|uniref:hypothetical protein n=1 Tax=unclassified Streptomyces TaxID=2593676 RepID=UPI0036FFCECD